MCTRAEGLGMSTGPAPYQRIADQVRRLIESGKLRAGDRAPSTRALVRDHGIAMATATKVLATLQQEGLVHTRPGVGTVVGPAPRQPAASRSSGPSSHVRRHSSPSSPVPRSTSPSSPVPRQSSTGVSPSSALSRSSSRRVSQRPAGPAGAHPVGGGGPEPLLSREEVVRAAIAIADEEGLAALSMRRIATDLGVSTMALYRYVGGKEALVLQMVDTAIGDFPFPAERPASWREGIETVARLQWSAYRAHLWLPGAVSLGRPQALPNLLPHTDAVLRAVSGFGVDGSTSLSAAITVFGYVRGVALNLEPEARAEQDTGMTADEWADHQSDQFVALIGAQDLR